MSPAELKSMREFLGLTLQWVADRAGVAPRTAQFWEAGRQRVPADVAHMLLQMDSDAQRIVIRTQYMVEDIIKQQGRPPEAIMLLRYRTDADLWQFRPDMQGWPAMAHAAIMSRVQRTLWAMGIPTGMEYMDPDAYLAWLAGRTDSEALRSAWALEIGHPPTIMDLAAWQPVGPVGCQYN